MNSDALLKNLRIIGAILGILVVLFSPFVSYFLFKEAVAQEISNIKIDMAKNYVDKKQVEKVTDAVDRLEKVASKIEGMLTKPSY